MKRMPVVSDQIAIPEETHQKHHKVALCINAAHVNETPSSMIGKAGPEKPTLVGESVFSSLLAHAIKTQNSVDFPAPLAPMSALTPGKMLMWSMSAQKAKAEKSGMAFAWRCEANHGMSPMWNSFVTSCSQGTHCDIVFHLCLNARSCSTC